MELPVFSEGLSKKQNGVFYYSPVKDLRGNNNKIRIIEDFDETFKPRRKCILLYYWQLL